MSIALLSAVWKTGLSSYAQKIVLLALCDNASDEGICFPSTTTLALKCDMSRATLFRQLAALEEAGFFQRQHRPNQSSLYQIAPPESWPGYNPRRFPKRKNSPLSDIQGGSQDETAGVSDRDGVGLRMRLRGSQDETWRSQDETHNHHLTVTEPSINHLEGSQAEPSPKSKGGKSSNHGKRIPSDWQPSEEDIAFARQGGIEEVEEVAAHFRDYWTSESGAKAKKRDWSAAWRNWVRNAKRFGQRRQKNQGYNLEDAYNDLKPVFEGLDQ